MTPEIWQDILTRLKNLRGDMVGQWQGNLDNHAIEHAIGMLGSTIEAWQAAQPVSAPPVPH